MIVLLVALALLRGLVYVVAIPPWQSPDEHGHFEYAWLMSQHGPLVGPESISPEFQQRVLRSMYAFDYWRLAHQPIPATLPVSLTDPADPLLRLSRPQVGDERPLYYLLVGGLLRLTGDQNLVTSMYLGRVISVVLYSAAMGVATLAARRLFPHSLFMQVVPLAFLLFLPMLGEMGAAVNSDAMGILTGTLFFASLIPVFRDGLTWRRGGATVGALVLALLSKKTTLFFIPTALLVLPVYGWTHKVQISRRVRLALAIGVTCLTATVTATVLIPGDDAAGWIEWTGSCGPTRLEKEAYAGEAAIRLGTCTDEVVSQALPQEVSGQIAGQQVVLTGQARGETGSAVGQVTIWESGRHTATTTKIAVEEEWKPFTATHIISPEPQLIAVRLTWGESGGPVLFDDLALTSAEGENLLSNGSAEQKESLFVDLLTGIGGRIGAPLRWAGRLLLPESWSLQAWQGYLNGAIFTFHSFWGHFGWLALPLSSSWYWAIELACTLALLGCAIFVARKPPQTWRTGYLFVLMISVCLLALQTFLPLVINRGTYWLPQGRYLFPGAFAIAILMAWGFYQLTPGTWKSRATLVAVGLMAGFDLACLVFLIIPYFYMQR